VSMANEDGKTAENELRKTLAEVLSSQDFGVLATHGEGQPYCSLIGFAALPDFTSIVFATMRSTRKFGNLKADPRAAIMIDTRANGATDLQEAIAVTALGEAHEVSKTARNRYLRYYLDKHSDLADFIMSPDCALLCMRVRKYVIVQRFQEVAELNL